MFDMAPIKNRGEADTAEMDLKAFAKYCFKQDYKTMPFHRKWYDTIQNQSVKRGLIISPRNSAKSTCWGRVGALWLLGKNPDLRIVLISRTSSMAKNNMRFLRLHIESNDRVHEVFPYEKIDGKVTGLKPSTPWGEDHLTVKNNRNDGVPSVYAVGLEGSITGIRADIIIVDDLVDINNVMSAGQREKVKDFWNNVVMPTLNPNGRILVVGTRWHSKDFYSRLLEDETYKKNTSIFPAIIRDEETKELILDENGKMQSYWPDKFPIEALLKTKEDMGSLSFNAQYMCDIDGYAGTVFDPEHLQYYDPIRDLPSIWKDLSFIMSVDPNITESPDSDNTAVVTAAIDHKRGNIYVLDIYAKPLDFVGQVSLIKSYGSRLQVSVGDHRFESEIHISKIGVEAVAYQRSLQQTGYLMGLPVVEVKQGNRDKIVRILGLQPHFENGRIRFPNPDKYKTIWWDKFYEEYCTFPKGRRDDMLDSLEILVSMMAGSLGASGVPWGPSDNVQRRNLGVVGRFG